MCLCLEVGFVGFILSIVYWEKNCVLRHQFQRGVIWIQKTTVWWSWASDHTLWNEWQSVRPKNFLPRNLFAQNAVRAEFVCPPILNVQGPFAHILWMYYKHTMAYHRSCVMLKIPMVHSLNSVQISSTIFKI